jgi:hypothetical protein
MRIRNFVAALCALALSIGVASAQNRVAFNGVRSAIDYAYGVNAKIAPLRVDVGNAATGSQTITLAYGFVTLADGTVINPLSTTAPITIGIGANAETVTPSAVSCSTPTLYSTCSITATFANTHGEGDVVASGSFGLIEAVNDAHTLGGLVAIDGRFAQAGGVTATITGNKGFTNVCILDYRGTTGATSYKAASNGANMAATAVTLY